MDKSKKYERAKQEDALFEKMVYWIITVLVLEFLLLILNRYYINYSVSIIEFLPTIQNVMTAFCVIFPICAIALGYWHQKKKQAGFEAVIPFFSTVLATALSVCTIVVRLFRGDGLSLLYLVVPGVAVLAIIYYLYQREFFYVATLSAMGLLVVRMLSQMAGRSAVSYLLFAICVAILVIAFLAFRCNQQGKPLTIAGKSITLLPKQDVNYSLMNVTCGIVLVVTAVSMASNLYSIYYGILVAWLLILAVYYTIKLM